jgi:hypothetical protein
VHFNNERPYHWLKSVIARPEKILHSCLVLVVEGLVKRLLLENRQKFILFFMSNWSFPQDNKNIFQFLHILTTATFLLAFVNLRIC